VAARLTLVEPRGFAPRPRGRFAVDTSALARPVSAQIDRTFTGSLI